MTANQALAAMTAKMTELAGAPVEITIRGDRAFTFSLDVGNAEPAHKLVRFFKEDARNVVTYTHDSECGSFVYVDAGLVTA